MVLVGILMGCEWGSTTGNATNDIHQVQERMAEARRLQHELYERRDSSELHDFGQEGRRRKSHRKARLLRRCGPQRVKLVIPPIIFNIISIYIYIHIYDI